MVPPPSPEDLTSYVKSLCLQKGFLAVGIADLSLFYEEPTVTHPELIRKYTRAIVLALRVEDPVIDKVTEVPTPEYIDHYNTLNIKLDRMANGIHESLKRLKYKSMVVPASKYEDRPSHRGLISHKALGRMAGLGWQGKSLLLINPEWGPRMRLVSVLTDAPLIPDGPIPNQCGSCTLCTDACPAGVIKNSSTKDRFKRRSEAVDVYGCYDKLVQFKRELHLEKALCGVCVSVCRFGRQKGE
jgi:epoxyqueuosine reductase